MLSPSPSPKSDIGAVLVCIGSCVPTSDMLGLSTTGDIAVTCSVPTIAALTSLPSPVSSSDVGVELVGTEW